MGRTESRELAQIRVDVHGAVSYDSVVTQDMRREQKVYASYADLLPKQVAQEDLALPSEEQLEETTEKTRKALEALTQKSVSAAKPRAASHAAAEEKEPVYYRYTPSSKQASASQTPDQRIIRIHEMPVDPLEPPKFKHKKAPARPPSPPVPVLHSPPKKLTPEDRKNWMIPPCISNWKNIKGYTVSAEKRLVADGRGMLELEVNDKFAHFADALYQAERAAAQALQEKAKMRKNIALKQKEVREQELRELARQAREKAGSASVLPEEDDSDQVDEEDVEALEERETLRKEMRRERRREIRMHNKGTKREKRDRELERDISERVALGQLGPSSAPSGESLFDHRLFNQTQGLSTGYGADDSKLGPLLYFLTS
jgi:SNW domain-containing protein 1